MAGFVTVDLSEEEKAALGKNYFKFEKIGDLMHGRFVRTEPATGKFAKPGDLSYVFKIKQNGATIETAIDAFNATSQLKVAMEKRNPPLKTGMVVKVLYSSDLSTGQANPMKVFKVSYDPDSATPTKAAAPPPPPKPVEPAPEAESDDVPF